jgi:metallo-beta-lactamase class B
MLRTLFLLLTATIGSTANLAADPPRNCDACDAWNRPRQPFRVWGNTWFVGTAGLGSILITSKAGHVLIDGGLPQSAPVIAANIQKLGFRLEDIRLILNTHAHYDHAGGIAALEGASGAQVAASPKSKAALEGGSPTEDDPQFAFGLERNRFPPVSGVRELHDGETLHVGDIVITAHFTPGHTPGGTSWTWAACDHNDCMAVAYMDSLNAVSAPGFHFTGDAKHESRVDEFRKSIDRVSHLECGIALAPHPDQVDLDARVEKAHAAHVDHLDRDLDGCRRYAEAASHHLDTRVAEEKANR